MADRPATVLGGRLLLNTPRDYTQFVTNPLRALVGARTARAGLRPRPPGGWLRVRPVVRVARPPGHSSAESTSMRPPRQATREAG
ncbi:hypothetical protein SB85_09240 [Xanthomonas sacchari]|nr:hypothetical protein SB85_09240 [Xanthomonas sacchari]